MAKAKEVKVKKVRVRAVELSHCGKKFRKPGEEFDLVLPEGSEIGSNLELVDGEAAEEKDEAPVAKPATKPKAAAKAK